MLRVRPLLLTFRAIDELRFPEGPASNTLRGALGLLGGAGLWPARRSPERGNWPSPSGLADAPPPFVLRSSHLDQQSFAPNSEFHFHLHLFETRDESLALIQAAFSRLYQEGLGPGRARVELLSIANTTPIEISLAPPPGPIPQLTVHFQTPTELKSRAAIAQRPDFPILAARLRDRIATLSDLYGTASLDLDFRAFATRAAGIRMTHCDIHHESAHRRSTRTGQTHPLGGFVGQASYEGDLREFLPWLEAAHWTGVGRQTAWGKGQLRTQRFGDAPHRAGQDCPQLDGRAH